ncbi:MAG: hypothetical protein ABIR80_00545 [Opitutaceae bacterium]
MSLLIVDDSPASRKWLRATFVPFLVLENFVLNARATTPVARRDTHVPAAVTTVKVAA